MSKAKEVFYVRDDLLFYGPTTRKVASEIVSLCAPTWPRVLTVAHAEDLSAESHEAMDASLNCLIRVFCGRISMRVNEVLEMRKLLDERYALLNTTIADARKHHVPEDASDMGDGRK